MQDDQRLHSLLFYSMLHSMLPPGYPWVSSINLRQFGSAVWRDIADKYICISKVIMQEKLMAVAYSVYILKPVLTGRIL